MTLTLFTSTRDFKRWRQEQDTNCRIGFVPTMGNLHAGHCSLVDRSLGHHPVSVVSIFVNPKQFGPNEDFNRYPRTLEQDLEQLAQLLTKHPNKALVVFAPSDPAEIYPEGFCTTISLTGITSPLCGQFRPGHFDGVTTVVHRLLTIVRPRETYLGLKDYQQFKVIERMVLDLEMNIAITPHEIIRDRDGLALSSRNQYLSTTQRVQALTLPRAIEQLKQMIVEHGLGQALEARMQIMQDQKNGTWQYLEILNADTLMPLEQHDQRAVIAGAFIVGSTRLIDNTLITL